jgi:hypothetical protein
MRGFEARPETILLGKLQAESPTNCATDSAAQASALVPLPVNPDGRHGVGLMTSPGPSIHVILLLALFWTPFLGQSSFAGIHPAPEKALVRHGLVRATKIIRFVTHFRMSLAESENDSTLASVEDPAYSSVHDRQNDQSDDGTSEDPNDDDDAWDDLNATVDMETPVIVWLPQTVLFLFAPEPKLASCGFESPISPSLTLDRLRC